MINKLNLRPIPGPVPDTFFRDVPPNARAVFSTLDGQRLPRPAPNRNSHFCVRSDDDDTIHQRALSLLRSYPSIACSVTDPLVVWEDLYDYFDAYDLWMESPGVLFQVIGQIARINLARNNEIDFYATEWINTNTARLAVLLQGQDVMSAIFTKADEQFFDVATLTPYEKTLLARTLNRKCESSYPAIDSLQKCQQKKQRQVGGGDYRLKRYLQQHSELDGAYHIGLNKANQFVSANLGPILTFHQIMNVHINHHPRDVLGEKCSTGFRQETISLDQILTLVVTVVTVTTIVPIDLANIPTRKRSQC
jgi:hypothetical protein